MMGMKLKIKKKKTGMTLTIMMNLTTMALTTLRRTATPLNLMTRMKQKIGAVHFDGGEVVDGEVDGGDVDDGDVDDVDVDDADVDEGGERQPGGGTR